MVTSFGADIAFD